MRSYSLATRKLMVLSRRIFSLGAVFIAVVFLPRISGLSTASASHQHQTTRREAFVRSVGTAVITATPFLFLDSATAQVNEDTSEYIDGPNGIKYLVTKEANPNGKNPERSQKIETSYALYINGFPGTESSKLIDSSKKLIIGEQPFKLRAGVKECIRGWDLSLMDMKEGEARRLIIPSDLAYGDKGVGPIPAKATLYFEMQLLKLEEVKELSEDAKKWLSENPL